MQRNEPRIGVFCMHEERARERKWGSFYSKTSIAICSCTFCILGRGLHGERFGVVIFINSSINAGVAGGGSWWPLYSAVSYSHCGMQQGWVANFSHFFPQGVWSPPVPYREFKRKMLCFLQRLYRGVTDFE